MAAKANSFQQILDPEEASRLACGQASVKLQPRWQLGRYGNFISFLFFFFLQKFTKFGFSIGSLALETNGGLMVFKSLPAKEPKVGICSIQLYLSTTKVGRLGLTLENPGARHECQTSFLFAWDAKTKTLTRTTRNDVIV